MDERYQQIVAAVDAEFARNSELHGEKIHCRPGCSHCCSHVFRITPLEAAEIGHGIQRLPRPERERLEARAREYVDARPLPSSHLACPALQGGVCSIYDFRPLLCHKFGMPIYNPERPDRIFACELNFSNGEEIGDPKLIQIQTSIHEAWKKLLAEYGEATPCTVGSRFTVAEAILLLHLPGLPTTR